MLTYLPLTVLILYSLAFLMFLFVMMLIHLYDVSANAPEASKPAFNDRAVPGRSEEEGLREAGEFELEGLMSDEEDEEEASRRKLLRDDGFDNDAVLSSPSTTVGQNNERLA